MAIKAIYVTTDDGQDLIESGRGVTIKQHHPQGDGDRFHWTVRGRVKGEAETYFQGNPGVWQVVSGDSVEEDGIPF